MARPNRTADQLGDILIVFVMGSRDQAFKYAFETAAQMVQCFCCNASWNSDSFLQFLWGKLSFSQQSACSEQHFTCQPADQHFFNSGGLDSCLNPAFVKIAKKRRSAAGEIRGNARMCLAYFKGHL
jgi:hypothetical protein